MYKNTLLKFCLAILVCCPILVQAMGGIADNKLTLKLNKTESVFSVINETIIPKQADQATCETDNAYMLSAFEVKKIELKNYDYLVNVSQKYYQWGPETLENSVEFFHYEVGFLDFDYTLIKAFAMLEKQDFITTYIPLSKAPTKCYSFVGNQKLNLLCHYGLKQVDFIPGIIEQIKTDK